MRVAPIVLWATFAATAAFHIVPLGVRVGAASSRSPRHARRVARAEALGDADDAQRDSPFPASEPAADETDLRPWLALNACALVWGSQHVVIKLAVDGDLAGLSPALLNAARFAVAALATARFTPQPGTDRATWQAGAQLGLWTFLGFACQSIALLSTPASRSAFLLYLNVKLVPFFARALYGREIAPRTWASAVVALTGTALLAGSGPPLCAGDLWSVGAAAASAMFILTLDRTSAAASSPAALTAAANWCTLALCACWAFCADSGAGVAAAAVAAAPVTLLLAVAYLGALPTALCGYLQAYGQKTIPAERAAFVYALDPAWAALWAFFILGEALTPAGVLGAVLVVGAAAVGGLGGGDDGVKASSPG